MRLRSLLYAVAGWALVAPAVGVPIQLQSGTATFSQTCCNSNPPPYDPAQSVDGILGDVGGTQNGWGVLSLDTQPHSASSETAVWETAVDVAGPLVFSMYFQHSNPGHLLGRFRFSVTSDDRSAFADGLSTGGDVSANWTVLTSPSVTGPAGMTFTTLGDDSVLAGGSIAGSGVYEVTYLTVLTGITGIRLEALEHPSLPGNGPGFFLTSDGNFVLTEIQLDATAVPEPSSFALLAAATLGWLCVRRNATPRRLVNDDLRDEQ